MQTHTFVLIPPSPVNAREGGPPLNNRPTIDLNTRDWAVNLTACPTTTEALSIRRARGGASRLIFCGMRLACNQTLAVCQRFTGTS